MRRKSWLTGLFLIILCSIAIIVRMYYVNYMMAEVSISEDIYSAAKVCISENGLASNFTDGFQIQSLYIYNLYLVFLIFGNFTVAGVYLNILYQTLTILLVYIVLNRLINRYIGFVGGLVLAILPNYVGTLSEVTMQNMEIFVVVLIGTVVISVVRLFYRRYKRKNNTEKNDKGVTEQIDPKEEDKNNTSILLDASMKEIRYDDLEDYKIQYIENPLPVPKRKEHKEMDYAFEPTDNEDDYDIKDMTGKDFYDIE